MCLVLTGRCGEGVGKGRDTIKKEWVNESKTFCKSPQFTWDFLILEPVLGCMCYRCAWKNAKLVSNWPEQRPPPSVGSSSRRGIFQRYLSFHFNGSCELWWVWEWSVSAGPNTDLRKVLVLIQIFLLDLGENRIKCPSTDSLPALGGPCGRRVFSQAVEQLSWYREPQEFSWVQSV